MKNEDNISNFISKEDEDRILSAIKNDAERIAVPDSLLPEHINILISKHRNFKKRNNLIKIAGAACIIVFAGASITFALSGSNMNGVLNSKSKHCDMCCEDLSVTEPYNNIYSFLQQQLKTSNSVTCKGDQEESSALNTYPAKSDDTTDINYTENESANSNPSSLASESSGNNIKSLTDLYGPTIDISNMVDNEIHDDYLLVFSDNKENLTETLVDIYDISNTDNIELVSSFSQSGSFFDYYIYNNLLYVTSRFVYSDLSSDIKDNYIPKINNSYIDEDKIFTDDSVISDSFAVISCINLSNPICLSDNIAIYSNMLNFIHDGNEFNVTDYYINNNNKNIKTSFTFTNGIFSKPITTIQ